jgi:hypothetical protein
MVARPAPVNRWNPPLQPMNRVGRNIEGAKIYQQSSPLSPRPSFGMDGKNLSSSPRPVFSPAGKQPAYSASASRNNAEGTQPSVVRPVFPSDHSRPSLASRPEFGSAPPWRGSGLGMSNQGQGRPEFISPTQNTERALFSEHAVAPEAKYARPGQPAPSTWSYHAPWASHRTTTQADLATHSAVIATSRANPTSHGIGFSAGRYEAPSASLSGSSANNIATNNVGNFVGSIERATAHTLSLAGETMARQATPGNVYGTALSTVAGLAPGGYGLGIDAALAQNNMVNGASDLRNATSALYSGKLSQAAVGYGGVAWNAGLGFVHGMEMAPAALDSGLQSSNVAAGYALQSSSGFNKIGQSIPQLSSDLIGRTVQTATTASRDVTNTAAAAAAAAAGSAVNQVVTPPSWYWPPSSVIDRAPIVSTTIALRDGANTATTIGGAIPVVTTASKDVTNIAASIGGAASQAATTASKDIASAAATTGNPTNLATTAASSLLGAVPVPGPGIALAHTLAKNTSAAGLQLTPAGKTMEGTMAAGAAADAAHATSSAVNGSIDLAKADTALFSGKLSQYVSNLGQAANNYGNSAVDQLRGLTANALVGTANLGLHSLKTLPAVTPSTALSTLVVAIDPVGPAAGFMRSAGRALSKDAVKTIQNNNEEEIMWGGKPLMVNGMPVVVNNPINAAIAAGEGTAGGFLIGASAAIDPVGTAAGFMRSAGLTLSKDAVKTIQNNNEEEIMWGGKPLMVNGMPVVVNNPINAAIAAGEGTAGGFLIGASAAIDPVGTAIGGVASVVKNDPRSLIPGYGLPEDVKNTLTGASQIYNDLTHNNYTGAAISGVSTAVSGAGTVANGASPYTSHSITSQVVTNLPLNSQPKSFSTIPGTYVANSVPTSPYTSDSITSQAITNSPINSQPKSFSTIPGTYNETQSLAPRSVAANSATASTDINQAVSGASKDVTNATAAMGNTVNQAVTTASKDVVAITNSLSSAIKSIF